MQIDFPFHFDLDKRTAVTTEDDNIRDMIEQLLFTNPGERVNRPDFGSGLLQMVHAPNSPELASALQFTTQAALQQYLGSLIEVRSLRVTAEDARLTVHLVYLPYGADQTLDLTLSRLRVQFLGPEPGARGWIVPVTTDALALRSRASSSRRPVRASCGACAATCRSSSRTRMPRSTRA